MPAILRKFQQCCCLLAALCWAGSLSAAGPGPEGDPVGDRDGVFWSLNLDGRLAGYVLGTIHSEDPRVLDFSEVFIERVESCDVFAMELVPDLPTLGRLNEYMRLPPGRSLGELIGAERFGAVSDALRGYGMAAEQVATLKPWAAMMTLSVPPPRTGLFMDFSLSLRAAGSGLRVVGLETLEEQLAFLEALPAQRQLELLDHAVREFERVEAVHREMVDSYLRGSLDDLERQAMEQLDDLAPATREYFIDEGVVARNRRMARRALELLDEETVLIAVGALHLPGDEGLLALLAEAGYEPRPLPSPFAGGAGTAPAAVDRSGAQRIAAELGGDQGQGAGAQ